MPTGKDVKFAFLMGLVTAGVISFTLVTVNHGLTAGFVFVWLRSWLIATIIAVFSILFIAPLIRKFLG